MAHKRRKKAHRRRSRKGMSEGKSFMSAGGRKSRHRKGKRRSKRGFLSESFSPNKMQTAGKSVVGGLVGGGVSSLLNMFEMSGLLRAGINLGASFIASTVLDAPNMSAGIAGAYGSRLIDELKAGTLKEDYDYANQNVLEEHSQFADAQGNPMFLADDGNLYYLDENVNPEDELQENMYLSDNIYPNYINATNY